jgi:molybdopterin/thiamine biosynthesis adenylyltransferase
MPEQPTLENNCETEGIFSPVAGVMGSLQANEVLKTVLDLKSDLNKNMLIFNSLKMSLRTTKINVNKKCINKCKK